MPATRRLRHRVPVRVRRHWRLLAGIVVVGVATAALFGTDRVRPLVLRDTAVAADPVAVDVAGTVDVFDRGRPHQLALTFADADYRRMLTAFFNDDSKEYVKADLTVDGTVLPDVGIRLKGNSTLGSLRQTGQTGQAGGAVRGGGRFGPPLSTEEPENLPWLISFDEFVDGRRYQGREEIAVRPAGTAAISLAEAVALELVGTAGAASQRFASTSFTVNGRPSVTRLLVEHPDDAYADSLGGRGVLYKALSTGQFAYRGEDPTAYQNDFDQINRNGSQDLQPVIDLVRWVTTAPDAEFVAGLAERLDVEAFARYVALHNLLLNFDDMAGPGHNYYLYYDLDRQRFTVITWDLNFAFSGPATQGPFAQGRPGGGPGAGPPPGGGPGVGPPPGGGLGPIRGPGGGPGGGNRLKERFLAAPEFREVYAAAYRTLYRQFFAGGAALRAVDRVAAELAGAPGADTAAVTTAASALRGLIEQRTASLATDPLITGG